MRDFETPLTLDRLRSAVRYDAESGRWIRLVDQGRWGRFKAGTDAGRLRKKGYVAVVIDGYRYFAHRLAWFYMTGTWPVDQIDHKNTITSDNSWSNLRAASNQQNHANRPRPAHNTSGFKGVSWSAEKLRWRAYITVDGRMQHLGYFDEIDEAASAYASAAHLHFQEFARAA